MNIVVSGTTGFGEHQSPQSVLLEEIALLMWNVDRTSVTFYLRGNTTCFSMTPCTTDETECYSKKFGRKPSSLYVLLVRFPPPPPAVAGLPGEKP